MIMRPLTHKPYTAAGSRNTPEEFLALQVHCGRVFCDLGWHGFSGLAKGPDACYYQGAQESVRFQEIGFTNIIPYSGFKSTKECTVRHYHNPDKGIYAFDKLGFDKRAYFMGIGARGTGINLTSSGIALHSRNAMQILDLDLRTKSRFLHCYAEPSGRSGRVKGGTATAVSLAMHFKIDVVNLATQEGMRRTLLFLEQHGVELDYEFYRKIRDSLRF